jgi:hypothetical protein
MNGGTNISLAIAKAGQLLQTSDTERLAQLAEDTEAAARAQSHVGCHPYGRSHHSIMS